jgi:hypothetical protein
VQPVGSAFGRALSTAIAERVRNRVYRVLPTSPRLKGRSFLRVRDNGLDKIEQFKRFQDAGISCPPWTTDAAQVAALGCETIFARKLINSTGGQGIVEFGKGDPVPSAPLYTGYIPKRAEYRFHVYDGQVIDIQQKRKRSGVQADFKVRNLENGFVYCRDDVSPPDGASDLAIGAVKALDYLYGAVDLIFNEKRGQCYVLEVNSRPGLEGSTPEKYAEAVINSFKLERK